MPTVGVFAAIFDEQGRILCVKQTGAPGRWSTPGGRMEKGESPLEALAREVEEETGLVIRPLRLIGVYAAPFRNDLALSFEVEIAERRPWQPNAEIAEHGWFAREALPQPMRAWTRARIEDAFDGQTGVMRVFSSKTDRQGDIVPMLLGDGLEKLAAG
jgi:8-oxo-dGTP diphosphatase